MILPENIKEIDGLPIEQQVQVLYQYITYMHEQLEFWASQVEKQMRGE